MPSPKLSPLDALRDLRHTKRGAELNDYYSQLASEDEAPSADLPAEGGGGPATLSPRPGPLSNLQPQEEHERLGVPVPPALGRFGSVPLTKDEREIYARHHDQLVHKALGVVRATAEYDQAPDPMKRQMLMKAVEFGTRTAREQFISHVPRLQKALQQALTDQRSALDERREAGTR